MNATRAFALALAAALAAAAPALGQPADIQWKTSARTLAALVADGFEVRAAGRNEVGPVVFAQKNRSVFRCWDYAPFICEELAAPTRVMVK